MRQGDLAPSRHRKPKASQTGVTSRESSGTYPHGGSVRYLCAPHLATTGSGAASRIGFVYRSNHGIFYF